MYLHRVAESVAPLDPSIADRVQFIRPEFPAVHGASLPAWIDRLGERPAAYATLGTVHDETPGLLETIVAALSGEDLDPW